MLRPLVLLPCVLLATLAAQEPAVTPVADTATASAAPDVAASPAVAKSKPVKVTPELLAKAKKTYSYDCALCHGATGTAKATWSPT